jgi:prephenate dehydrogenase
MLKWNRVTVVGCGLIGASFALALKESGACEQVAGWDLSPAVIDEALKRSVIDVVDRSFITGEEPLSDLLYLAMPVSGIIGFLQEYGSKVKRGATITDAGSTKVEICRAACKHLPEGALFVGGHPIAGSHHAGMSHARADLFTGAPYVLIGESTENDRRVVALKETLSGMGARVQLMTAAAHDRAMALVSHLPQLMASALAATVKSQEDADDLLKISGTGFSDMTRLAASPWQMWRDILATNPAPVADALSAVIQRLTELRDELERRSESGSAPFAVAEAMFELAQGPRRFGQ